MPKQFTPLEEQVRPYLSISEDGVHSDYEYAGLSKEGSILYRRKDGTILEVNPNLDFTRVLGEGITNGVFTAENSAEANPQGIVLRCEFIHELARIGGEAYNKGTASKNISDMVSSTVLDYYEANKSAIDAVCGEDSYYKYSYAWLHSKSPDNIEGLYSFRDMQGALTWFELSYILYFVLKFKKTYRWTSLQPPANLRVTYIKTVKNHKDTLEDRLTEYKGSFNWMKSYLNALQSGRKAIPITVFWAMAEVRFNLSGVELDSSYTWATVEITRQEFESSISPFVTNNSKVL